VATREFSEEERTRLADKGQALPDKSFPMPDCDAVRRAIHAYGRADPSNRPDLRRLLRKRNEELHCGHDLDALNDQE
jgi:hypothetical protein